VLSPSSGKQRSYLLGKARRLLPSRQMLHGSAPSLRETLGLCLIKTAQQNMVKGHAY